MGSITLKNLEKKYGNLKAVHGIELSIKDGEFVVFVGPSGCAKSTTLRMIAGLEEVSGGEVFIGDRLVNNLPPRERNVSMVFQSYALYPHMTVAENLAFSLMIAKMPTSEIESRVAEAANILGLEELMTRLPAQLSGGQRQRVAMGRAIVRNPEVFLFDEPLSNLDAKLRTKMRAEIKKLHQRLKTTMVYVTHDQVEAMSLADRVVIMREGRIEQVGTPMEVFLTPKNIFVAGFVGSPAMNFLDGVVQGDSLLFENGDSLLLPQHIKSQSIEGQVMTVGVRPENIYLLEKETANENAGFVIETKPTLFEPLGSEGLIIFSYNSEEFSAKIFTTDIINTRQSLRLAFSIENVHFFDKETTLRIGSFNGKVISE